ncbi:MAG: DUF1572 family protein, partial [Planctomycetes bacterium]|nr:DUF1572 family protein [Planctomycetota bacterium]
MTDVAESFLAGVTARMKGVKALGDGVLRQVSAEQLFHRTDVEGNSVAIIVRHLHGNMLSRWTDFLKTDGEKSSRTRDLDFEQPQSSPGQINELWQQGWDCTLNALTSLQPDEVLCEVQIRGQPLTVMDAILRQLAHYSYHVGQMVTLAREQLGDRWQTLSIARGKSEDYKPV